MFFKPSLIAAQTVSEKRWPSNKTTAQIGSLSTGALSWCCCTLSSWSVLSGSICGVRLICCWCLLAVISLHRATDIGCCNRSETRTSLAAFSSAIRFHDFYLACAGPVILPCTFFHPSPNSLVPRPFLSDFSQVRCLAGQEAARLRYERCRKASELLPGGCAHL